MAKINFFVTFGMKWTACGNNDRAIARSRQMARTMGKGGLTWV
jgi:hypothetical protein